MAYEDAYAVQEETREAVLARRGESDGVACGTLLLVEHDPPVITVSRRASASGHLLASEAELTRLGVVVRETDRGGDITYHGTGQLVAYPIVDLNRLGLNLHGYLRFLEDVVIATCLGFGVEAGRDESEPAATGVWVGGAKIAAMGVRVRRWVTMHGLALNVDPEMAHFGLINACGLGRPVTSLAGELAGDPPRMDAVKASLTYEFTLRAARLVRERADG
jgi:lipoate-protein ligase B